MVIELRLETANMRGDLEKVKGQLASLGSSSVAASGGVSTLAGGFTKMLGAAGLILGVSEAFRFLADATKSAAEENEAITILHGTLKNVAGASPAVVASVDAQIAAMEKMSGVVDDKIRPSFDVLLRATGNVTESLDLQKLALDVSAGTGKDVTTVATALAKAHDGNKAALSRLVPGIKGASDQMGFLRDKFSGAAKEAADANPYKRMEVTIDGLKETIGGAFLPIVQQLADLFVKISPIITMVSQVVADLVLAFMPFITEIMNVLMPILTPLMQVLMSLVKMALTPVMIAFKLLMIPITNAGKNFSSLFAGLAPLFDLFAQVAGLIMGAFNKAWAAITKAVAPVVKMFQSQMSPEMSNMKKIMSQVAGVITGSLAISLNIMVTILVKVVEKGIKVAIFWLNAIKTVAKAAGDWLRTYFGGALQALTDFLKPFIDALKTAWGWIVKVTGADVKVKVTAPDTGGTGATDSSPAVAALGGGGGGGSAAVVVNHAAIIAKANKTFHAAIKAVQKQFQADSLALLTDHNNAVKGIMAQGVANLTALIDQSKGMLTSAFKAATTVDAGSMFLSAGGSITNFMAMMKEKLAGAKALADSAAKLSGAGYSQEFIQQIIAQGPQVGSALADQLLAGGPEQAAAMQDIMKQVNDVSNHGVDDLATQINAGGHLATDELRTQFATAQADLVAALNNENLAYARSVDQLERAVAVSMAKLKITRDKALRDQYKAMGTAAGNRNANAMTRDIAAQNAIIAANAEPNVTNINTTVTAQTNASAASIASAVIAEIKFGAPVIVKAA